ncbi:hypothetical protein LTR85_005943 [Meristemomyces frigidus]|nr:hypothetical protein LTR85_005943 [Meristemomyces frigidus]
MAEEKKTPAVDVVLSTPTSELAAGEALALGLNPGNNHLQRRLGGKEVQLFAIGGAVGSGIFLGMGQYLPHGGPAGLFLGFGVWSLVAFCINECFAEMACYAPVPVCFVEFAKYWVDDALAFAVSWAFFICQALLVPGEITGFVILMSFWTDKIPTAALVMLLIVAYGWVKSLWSWAMDRNLLTETGIGSIINCIDVKWFGRVEFYLSIGKVFLVFLCFGFTIVTMCGGNPLNDAYGFRYWNNPGAFAEYLTGGSLGGFWGFLSCMSLATFNICGPEYLSSVAGETVTPRRVLPACYRSFPFRLLLFFVGSALCIGIVIPYNDPTLAAYIAGTTKGTAAASPYVIAMERLKISGLPHFVNAVMMTSVFSCGNGVFFAASRALYVMGKEGRAPAIFGRTTKRGIPIYATIACLLISLLALLQISSAGSTVLHYFIDLCTVTGLLNYLSACISYVHFYHAMKAQGRSRDSLPYKGRFQPYAAYIGIFGTTVMNLVLGFDILVPFEIKWFFLDYTLIAAFPVAFVVWKYVNKTTYHRLGTGDLGLGGLVKEVDDYEDLVQPKPEGWMEKIWSGNWQWSSLKKG